MRNFPRLETGNTPDLLYPVLLACTDDVRELAGIGINKLARYKSGAEPVPLRVFQLLKILTGHALPDCWGEFQGLRRHGDRIYLEGDQRPAEGIRRDEILMARMNRADLRMLEGQADLIERISKERDFYKRQVGTDARLGLMVWRCFGE